MTLSLSEAGKAVLEKAKRITAELGQIHEIGRFHQNPRAGSLRIGVIPTVGPYLLPHCLKNLRKGFPEMKYYFHEMKSNEIVSALHERRIDLGLLALSINEERLEEKAIFKESFYLAVPKGHQSGKTMPVNDPKNLS
jgi:LysR family transcriptional regulator, hydrogen peroxide-inducible genes activator